MKRNDYMHELRRALYRADMPDGCKLLVYNLTNFANGEGERVRPSNGTIELAQNASDKTLRNYRRWLEDAGWLVLVRKGVSGEGRGGQRRTNEYQLAIGRSFKINWTTEPHPDTGKPRKLWNLKFVNDANDVFLSDDEKATRQAARAVDNVTPLPARPPKPNRERTSQATVQAAGEPNTGWDVDEVMSTEIDFGPDEF